MLEGGFKLSNGDVVSFNYKCIIASLFFAGFYWYAPKKNKWILALILYSTYLAIAWYDHFFSCLRYPMKPTFLYSFYGRLKPHEYQAGYQSWKPSTKRFVFKVDMVILFIILLVIGLSWSSRDYSTSYDLS